MNFRYPLYNNDGRPAAMDLTARQLKAIDDVRLKLSDGAYRTNPCFCLCGNEKADEDIVLSKKDRYGLPISSLICLKCGLIRSARIMAPHSLAEFYQQEYRVIYSDSVGSPESLFSNQVVRGQRLLTRLRSECGLGRGSVFEVGCGAGGILKPFRDAGWDVSGCDYEEKYLEYGRSQGLNLRLGSYESMHHEKAADLLLLSHVLEHFADPLKMLILIVERMKNNGLLLVEVPGIFRIHEVYFSPLLYLQGAHVYSFTAQHLRVLFESLGLRVVSGDQKCVFIVQKPASWKLSEAVPVFDDSLAGLSGRVARYIWANHVLFSFRIHPFYWALKAADVFGVKKSLARMVESLRAKRHTV